MLVPTLFHFVLFYLWVFKCTLSLINRIIIKVNTQYNIFPLNNAHMRMYNFKYFATYFSYTLHKLVYMVYTENIVRHRSPLWPIIFASYPCQHSRSHRMKDLEFRISFDCFRSAAFVHYTYYLSSPTPRTKQQVSLLIGFLFFWF